MVYSVVEKALTDLQKSIYDGANKIQSRFNQLERSLHGISPKTLSERLRSLEVEGIIVRQTFAEVPPRVEYSLTEKGLDLIYVVESMRNFGKRWLCNG